jgi:hypothetical protein
VAMAAMQSPKEILFRVWVLPDKTSLNIISFANIYVADALERKKWWQCRGTI